MTRWNRRKSARYSIEQKRLEYERHLLSLEEYLCSSRILFWSKKYHEHRRFVSIDILSVSTRQFLYLPAVGSAKFELSWNCLLRCCFIPSRHPCYCSDRERVSFSSTFERRQRWSTVKNKKTWPMLAENWRNFVTNSRNRTAMIPRPSLHQRTATMFIWPTELSMSRQWLLSIDLAVILKILVVLSMSNKPFSMEFTRISRNHPWLISK